MKTINHKLLTSGIFLFILFSIFSVLVALNFFKRIDYETTVIFQKIIPDFFITPFSTFSILGSLEVMGVALLALILFISGVKKIYPVILFTLVMVIEVLGKTFINQLPPQEYFHKTSLLLGLPSGGVVHDFFAYPSGHSARTAFISAFLILLIWLSPKLNKNHKLFIIFCILIFDFIMFMSRIYLGEHWMSDVFGGVLLGSSLAIFSVFLISLKRK